MRLLRTLLITQTCYYLLTGIWPLIHIDSFLAVTGPKCDVWLVKTVGALLIPVSLCLGSFLFTSGSLLPAAILGSTAAVAFISIDFYYALNDVIRDIYIADGVAQLVLIMWWVIVLVRNRQTIRTGFPSSGG